MEWYWFIGIIVVLAALFILWKKGVITSKDVSQVGEAVETLLPLVTAGSVFEKLLQYCEIAFHAAEQLMKTGEIAAEERKGKAMALVAEYAAVDGTALTDDDMKAVNSIIEANCDIKGHGDASETLPAEETAASGDVFDGTEEPVTGLTGAT